ncbi:izumo sperm-egg fusion protein 1 [Polypterus senegalus]|uniref:izumo sperm-egg fusion protein 1 n=1 Tax=Polypterus senegalus TaxID=55291 RepID=UPI0019651B51|nr:izumo sperm-egg fusion protein 1 [Polypterus senegalus]
MYPFTFLLLLGLLHLGRPARGCLQCDRSITQVHGDFLEEHTGRPELKKVIDGTYEDFKKASSISHDVVDSSTLYRMRTEYESEFQKFAGSKLQGPEVLFELINIMEKGKEILQKHLVEFVKTGFCPNKCGVMYQEVVNCKSCDMTVQYCPTPEANRLCGEFTLQVMEGEEIVIDCFLPWHSLARSKKEYQFSRALKLKTRQNEDFQVFAVTKEPRLVLNQVTKEDEKEYRCLLLSINDTVLTTMFYEVKVQHQQNPTHQTIRTVPTLPPDEETRPPRARLSLQLDNAVPVIIGVIVMAALVSGCCLSSFINHLRHHKAAGSDQTDDELREVADDV